MKSETYIVLDKKPQCRLYRVTSKRRIQNPPPWFVNGQDELSWWTDGKRRFLQVRAQTVRTARDDKKGCYVRLKETHHYWYLVNGKDTSHGS